MGGTLSEIIFDKLDYEKICEYCELFSHNYNVNKDLNNFDMDCVILENNMKIAIVQLMTEFENIEYGEVENI